MLISLYTSRVILDALGVEDYGIYNVVGGFVAMFTILCGSMSTAISRFITFELGRKESNRLLSIFSTSVTIQLLIAVLVTIIAEFVGVWFLNTKMVIPENRLFAANWVYQFSIITFVINIISVPYNAAIIAHERMSAFAYISIYEGVTRLLLALIIAYSTFDRLIFFSFCIATIQLSIRFIYGIYCKRHFEECTYHFVFEKKLFREILGFAGWTFIGSSAIHLRDQGGNILINLFFGPAVNAARGVAMKVNLVVQQFVSNFMMALNPQITKNYASGNYDYMFNLMFLGARFSFYLLLIISLPLLINTEYILNLWLKEVPEYTSIFAKLFLILAMSDCLSNPIITAQSATGKIRNYQIVVGGMFLMNLPIVYILFKMGFHPAVSVVVAIIISQICLFLRLIMFKKNVEFSIWYYIRYVYINVMFVFIVALIPPIIVNLYIPTTFLTFVMVSIVSLLSAVISIGFIGCSSVERSLLYKKIRFVIEKYLKK